MRRIQLLGFILVFMLECISSAQASTMMFTDYTAWQTEVSCLGYKVTLIDFENATTVSSDTVTTGDVIFTSPGMPLEVTDYYGIPYNSGKVLYPAFNQPIQINLPGSVYAFGFELGELGGLIGPTPLPTLSNVVLSTGEVFPGPYNGGAFPVYAFFGFCSDLPITSLSISPHAMIEPIIDNYSYAQGHIPSPEPSSLLLLGFGSCLVGFVAGGWRNLRRSRMLPNS